MLLAQKLRASSREYSLPGAPTIITAYPETLTSNAVTFTAPLSDGGATITQYQAVSDPITTTGILNGSVGGTISVSGATQGSTYTYKVRAKNSVGWGPYSTDSTSVTTLQVPTNTVLPAITGTVANRSTLTCSTGTWVGVPGEPGDITYQYQWQKNSVNISGATNSTYTLVAADVGATIRCGVIAANTGGATTIYSNATAAVAAVVPDAPTIGTATQTGGTRATVTFTAPADNGGSTITSYTATSTPGNFTGTLTQAGSGTITVSGLSANTSYTFTVKATNAIGTSVESSSSNSITATPRGSLAVANSSGDAAVVQVPGWSVGNPSYTWTVPTGVTSISILTIGAGGSTTAFDNGAGGGGLAYLNNYAVTPGQQLYLWLDSGSWLTQSFSKVTTSSNYSIGTIVGANAGANNATNFSGGTQKVGTGGTVIAGTGFTGGQGGIAGGGNTKAVGGGGGAAGYAGNGGAGGGTSASGSAGAGGGGGGGGGGFNNTSIGSYGSGGGGGVGLYGQGANGAGGAGSGSNGNYGQGGSGGTPTAAQTTLFTVTTQKYGGGASNQYINSVDGGSGAIRIVWPGTRTFPTNDVGLN